MPSGALVGLSPPSSTTNAPLNGHFNELLSSKCRLIGVGHWDNYNCTKLFDFIQFMYSKSLNRLDIILSMSGKYLQRRYGKEHLRHVQTILGCTLTYAGAEPSKMPRNLLNSYQVS